MKHFNIVLDVILPLSGSTLYLLEALIKRQLVWGQTSQGGEGQTWGHSLPKSLPLEIAGKYFNNSRQNNSGLTECCTWRFICWIACFERIVDFEGSCWELAITGRLLLIEGSEVAEGRIQLHRMSPPVNASSLTKTHRTTDWNVSLNFAQFWTTDWF